MKIFLCYGLFAALACVAQDTTATIAGQVQDASGAGIAEARVTARNVQTGLERSMVTGESANYTLPLLPIGTYDVSAEKEGFKKLVQTGVVLQVDQHARVDLSLQVGETNDSR